MHQQLQMAFRDYPLEVIPSKNSISTILHQGDQYKSVKQLLKSPLSVENKRKRLEYAQSWFIDGRFVDRNVLWTDEVMVKSHPDNHRQWVLVRGDALKMNTQLKQSFPWAESALCSGVAYQKTAPGQSLPYKVM